MLTIIYFIKNCAELNKQMRKSKIQGLRKSILLNVLNNVLTMNFSRGF